MQLPSDILLKINYDFSRCHHPELLDWQMVRDTWTATTDDRKFILIHDDRLGYVIAEKKSITMGVSINL
ncbi:MAG: hypothetical protein WC455_30615 [Dehalococcoidia bacterium]|jgi:hypothetical protein